MTPPLILGTLCFGNSGPRLRVRPLDKVAAFDLLDAAFDLGIRDFDTASIYGAGQAEEWLGEWSCKRNRQHEIRIRTKVGISFGEHWSRTNNLISEVAGSLRRLQVSHVHTLSLHVFPAMPLTALAAELTQLHDENRFRRLASVNEPWARIDALDGRLPKTLQIHTAQVRYNVLHREVELDLHFTRRLGLKLEAWSPRAGGLITARLDEVPSQWHETRWHEIVEEPKVIRVRAVLQKVGWELSARTDQIAICWLLRRKVPVVLGARSIKDLEQCVHAKHLTLSEEQALLIDAASPPTTNYEFGFVKKFDLPPLKP
jgi:aryl-alcohol dehydrogenase-like predicted oxidoreductase